jgi:hypothetical protein
MGSKPPGGQVAAPVTAMDTHPECKSRHPPSTNPCRSTTMTTNPAKPPDGAAAAPVADAGMPPERTPQVTPSLARWPDEGGEGSGGRTSHEHLGSRHLRRGGNVRGTPLDLSSFLLLTLSLSIHYSLIPSIFTGSISSDCDCYGHSHVM